MRIRRVRRRQRPGSDESGFTLVETVVALSVLLVVLGAASSFFVRSIDTAALQRQRDAASALVDQNLEYARSVAATRLTDGRTPTAVDAQLTAGPTAADWSQGDPRTLNGSSAAVVLQLTQSTTVKGTKFLIRSFVSRCWRPATADASCTTTAPVGSAGMLRVLVSVSWRGVSGANCSSNGTVLPDGTCEVLGSTLIDPAAAEPVFREGS